jgi:uncharacterized protein (DUF779 family)
MCYAADEFQVGDADIYLGNLDGMPFYIGANNSNTGSTRS